MSAESVNKTVDIEAQSGQAIMLDAGDLVKLVDVEGQQVADLFACVKGEMTEWLSPGHTRTWNGNLFPRVGEPFYTQEYRPILTFVEDASPGHHDMFYPSCDRALYRRMGGGASHANCRDNFFEAAAGMGWCPGAMPDPVNFFQNTPVTEDGKLSVRSAATKPGDSVLLRAEMDLLLVVTACSQDLVPINGPRCTGLRLEISNPGANAPSSSERGSHGS